MAEKLLIDFIPTPRRIRQDCLNGKIRRDEWILYMWLRHGCDITGKIYTSFKKIKEEVFPGRKTNYITQLFRRLRSKKYIYYSDHRGSCKPFEVHFEEFVIGKGKNATVKTLEGYFAKDKIKNQPITESIPKSEVRHNSESPSQNFKEAIERIKHRCSNQIPPAEVRTPYNEMETKKNTNYDAKKIVDINTFKPANNDEDTLLEIARWLGEKDMRFLLSLLKKYPIDFIRNKFRYLQELTAIKPIVNRGAYFNRMFNSKKQQV